MTTHHRTLERFYRTADTRVAAYVRELLADGWQLTRRSNHYALVSPAGKKVTFSCRRNDPRAFLAMRAQIRRMQAEEGSCASASSPTRS